MVQPALQDEIRRSRGVWGPSLAENQQKTSPQIKIANEPLSLRALEVPPTNAPVGPSRALEAVRSGARGSGTSTFSDCSHWIAHGDNLGATQRRRRRPLAEAAIPTGTAEPPVWLKPVASPTDMGLSGFAEPVGLAAALWGAPRPKKQQLNPSSVPIGKIPDRWVKRPA